MNIFLDCGAHKGESLEKFKKTVWDSHEYQVHSFEPNPVLWEGLEKLDTILHKEAAWVINGETDFYLAESTDGSTLMKGKITGNVDYDIPIKVEAIDLSGWIMENFTKEDHIILKLDVEGAESEILSKMIIDGSIDYIDTLFVEFHYKKVGEITRALAKHVLRKLRELKLATQRWG